MAAYTPPTCGTRAGGSMMRSMRCFASHAKPTSRPRCRTSRCRGGRAGAACPGWSRGSIRRGPPDSISRPTNIRTPVRRPHSTPRLRPGRRAEGGPRAERVYGGMDEPYEQVGLKNWWVPDNTDFRGVAPDVAFGTQSAHPRAYGTFARILDHCSRDRKLFPLEFAVHKMTAL